MKANKTSLFPAIRRRLMEATPEPWAAYDWPSFPRNDEDNDGCVRIENKLSITAYCFSGKPNHDALLIANAPTDLAKLLACLDEAVEALTKISKTNNWYKNPGHFCDSQSGLNSVSDIARQALLRLSAEWGEDK